MQAYDFNYDDYLSAPTRAIISIGIDNAEIIKNDKCIASVENFIIGNNFNQHEELKQFCKRYDVITILADMVNPIAEDVLNFIVSVKNETETVFIFVISKDFENKKFIKKLTEDFYIVFSPETPLRFHNVIKVLYSVFGESFIGMDFCDVIAFFKWSPTATYKSIKCRNYKNNLDFKKTKDNISNIIKNSSSNNFGLFMCFQVPTDIGLEMIEDLAKSGYHENVGDVIWNAVFDENLKNNDITVHMLVGD